MAWDGAKGHPKETRTFRADEVAAIFGEHYPAYQYKVVQFIIEHLSDVGRAFNGDLQAMLVLAVIGQVHLNAHRSPDGTYRNAGRPPPERLSTSATRVADVTGIPRQTVRRKLDALEARGWILRNDDSTYRLAVEDETSVAHRALRDTDARAVRRFARLFADLERIVARGEAAEPASPPAPTGHRDASSSPGDRSAG